MSAATCALTLWAQKEAIVSTKGLSLMQRVTHAAVAYDHYLISFFAPRQLAIFYPYVVSLAGQQILTAAVALIFVTAVARSGLVLVSHHTGSRDWLGAGR